jgi:hypothetical protein
VRIVRNSKFINRRKRFSKLFVGVGVLMLFGSALPSLTGRESLVLPAYGALVIGFVLFIAGMQQVTRWSRRPRADVQLDETLARLNDRYAIFHFIDLGKQAPDHIVVTPGGTLVLTTKDVRGVVRLTGSRWRKQGGMFGRLFGLGAPQLGNPTLESRLQVESLEAFFDAHDLPGEIEGLIVFISDNVEIEMRDPELEVLHYTELADYVREVGAEVTLPNAERGAIVDALTIGDGLEIIGGSTPTRPRKKVRAA